MWATGLNDQGQLGDGSTIQRDSFVQVVSGGVKALAAGSYHRMVLTQDGSVWTTGSNIFGQLGDGATKFFDRLSFGPVLASGLTAAVKWQYDVWLHKHETPIMRSPPRNRNQSFDTNIPEHECFKLVSSGVQAIAAGNLHSLILHQDGSVWAAGSNDEGQLGDGTTIKRLTFVQVIASDVKVMAAGIDRSMVLKQDGSVWVTGRNVRYIVWLSKARTKIKNFIKVVSSGVQNVACGGINVILKQTGSVWETTSDEYSFVSMMSEGAKTVAAGNSHSVVLKQDGSVWVKGSNDHGQFGDGSRNWRPSFVQVLSDVRAISAGAYHSMVLKKDGSVWATGWNKYGQLGDGSTTDRPIFLKINST